MRLAGARTPAALVRAEVDIAHDDTKRNEGLEPLFPVWSTGLFRLLLALGAGAIIAIPAGLWAWERTPYVSGVGTPRPQPVKFDHRHHVRDDGISCTYCHADALRSAYAGMPPSSLCMGCHAQIWTNSPELAAVRRAYTDDAPLLWNRVTRLPHFVFFDHSIHVSKGVGCVSCHGRVDQMAEVYAVQPFSMQFCLDCHRAPDAQLRLDVQPRTDCSACHR